MPKTLLSQRTQGLPAHQSSKCEMRGLDVLSWLALKAGFMTAGSEPVHLYHMREVFSLLTTGKAPLTTQRPLLIMLTTFCLSTGRGPFLFSSFPVSLFKKPGALEMSGARLSPFL